MTSRLLVMTMFVLEEQLLSYQVHTECDCRDAEARERALESVPPCEGAGVAPGFAVSSSVC
jgi:hypothetical protein